MNTLRVSVPEPEDKVREGTRKWDCSGESKENKKSFKPVLPLKKVAFLWLIVQFSQTRFRNFTSFHQEGDFLLWVEDRCDALDRIFLKIADFDALYTSANHPDPVLFTCRTRHQF